MLSIFLRRDLLCCSSPARSPGAVEQDIIMMNHVYKERFPKVRETYRVRYEQAWGEEGAAGYCVWRIPHELRDVSFARGSLLEVKTLETKCSRVCTVYKVYILFLVRAFKVHLSVWNGILYTKRFSLWDSLSRFSRVAKGERKHDPLFLERKAQCWEEDVFGNDFN